jgi:hypothetical protein
VVLLAKFNDLIVGSQVEIDGVGRRAFRAQQSVGTDGAGASAGIQLDVFEAPANERSFSEQHNIRKATIGKIGGSVSIVANWAANTSGEVSLASVAAEVGVSVPWAREQGGTGGSIEGRVECRGDRPGCPPRQ